jgi:serine/threonine protein kinase
MARILPGGTPANESERMVIRHLRDHAPGDWSVIPAVELRRGARLYDVDLIVIVPHAVYLIDVKGTRGRIEAAGRLWHPEGRSSFGSPLAKLRAHARAAKGLIAGSPARAGHPELARVWVEALVVLTAPDAVLDDPAGRDEPQTTSLANLIDVLADTSRVHASGSSAPVPVEPVLEALGSLVRPRGGPLRFGSWQVVERLGGDEGFEDYRARNLNSPAASGTVLLRVYEADVYLSDVDLRAQRLRLGNAFEAISSLPPHANVVRVLDFFPNEDESRFVLVLDDARASALRVHLSRPQLALSADAKLRVMRGVLLGLAQVHRFGVLHRAINPSTILIAENGRPMLTGFDVAKPGAVRGHTVADLVETMTDPVYLAPECQASPDAASPVSDVYASGITFAEMFLGAPPFVSAAEQAEVRSILPSLDLLNAGATPELAAWLQRLCAHEPGARPSAIEAVRALDLILQRRPGPSREHEAEPAGSGQIPARGKDFYLDLPTDHSLTPKYIVRRRLGRPGTFGVAYRVFDTLEQIDKAIKLVFRDRDSVTERLRHEFQILLRLPPHPNVVRVLHADFLPGTDATIPYLVFEFVEGQDVREMIDKRLLGPADGLRLGQDLARGLAHLHGNDVYHCDIKPSNLLWTDAVTKLLDFNIAVSGDSTLTPAGGSTRYMPPDGGSVTKPTRADLVDRDLFAASVTVYEAVTGHYPWIGGSPAAGVEPRDPRALPGMVDLAPGLATLLLRAVSPRRSDRFRGAEELLGALRSIDHVRLQPPPALAPADSDEIQGAAAPADEASANSNPFVAYLQTLYSQSRRSNRGTRGLDQGRVKIYVRTKLDRQLTGDILAGAFRLVVITGNAGDGKTAFLEQLTAEAVERHGAVPGAARANGADFTLAGRAFLLNHDGSQDEDARDNDAVLADFFAPYRGASPSSWPSDQTRVIAINEGRIVDFLTSRGEGFPALADAVLRGLAGEPTPAGIAVVNLNARSIVAGDDGASSPDDEPILHRTLQAMVHPELWAACTSCDLASSCYARHNAQTLAHPTAGVRVIERLHTLYELVALRGRLHITLRDLRSALAYTLTSGRDCAQIHDLYKQGNSASVLDSFYFSSALGIGQRGDRLLEALKDLDVAGVPNPSLDRRLDYAGPVDGQALVAVDGRGAHDRALLESLFEQLPRGAAAAADPAAHRRYLGWARRRYFFEAIAEDRWRPMLPYRSAHEFLRLLHSPAAAEEALPAMLAAINRGEGLSNPQRLGNALALRVREVPGGTIRSYRLFPAEQFALATQPAPMSQYVESGPEALLLRHTTPDGPTAQLVIKLDLFELLQRLARGHQPGSEDRQGQILSLTVFKNILGASPYQQILLTETGHDLHQITRDPDGRLRMQRLDHDQPAGEFE